MNNAALAEAYAARRRARPPAPEPPSRALDPDDVHRALLSLHAGNAWRDPLPLVPLGVLAEVWRVNERRDEPAAGDIEEDGAVPNVPDDDVEERLRAALERLSPHAAVEEPGGWRALPAARRHGRLSSVTTAPSVPTTLPPAPPEPEAGPTPPPRGDAQEWCYELSMFVHMDTHAVYGCQRDCRHRAKRVAAAVVETAAESRGEGGA